jgi:hypothetical protein
MFFSGEIHKDSVAIADGIFAGFAISTIYFLPNSNSAKLRYNLQLSD